MSGVEKSPRRQMSGAGGVSGAFGGARRQFPRTDRMHREAGLSGCYPLDHALREAQSTRTASTWLSVTWVAVLSVLWISATRSVWIMSSRTVSSLARAVTRAR